MFYLSKLWHIYRNGFETKLSGLAVCLFLQGTKWYRTTIGEKNGAWGFADGPSNIRLNYADYLTSDGEKRLSWNVNSHSGNDNGRRCGKTDDLWSSPDWERVIFHVDWAKLAKPRALTVTYIHSKICDYLLLICFSFALWRLKKNHSWSEIENEDKNWNSLYKVLSGAN